jgi:predicted enzyme related to lactoylglutathione lyase
LNDDAPGSHRRADRDAGKPLVQLLVNIDVDDLARAEAFYCAALPLTVGRRFGASGLELLGASCAIYLLAKPEGSIAVPGGDPRRSYRRHWTPVHLDVAVESLEPALACALTAGAVLEQPVSVAAWGRMAVMADPFGHGFCLIEFTAAGYDAIATPPAP